MLTPAVSEDSSQLVRLEAAGPAGGSMVPSDGRGLFGPALFGLDTETLAACMVTAGEPAWRGRQLAEALYRQWVAELNDITTLPKALRQRLAAEGWQVGRPAIVQVFQSVDGTERYLVQSQVQSGAETVETGVPGDRSIVAGVVETVWMPEGDDGETGDGADQDEAVKIRKCATICVS